MNMQRNVFLSGGDAKRLGIIFVIDRLLERHNKRSSFLADIYFCNRKFTGVIVLYRYIGWEITKIFDDNDYKDFSMLIAREFERNRTTAFIHLCRLCLCIFTEFCLICNCLYLLGWIIKCILLRSEINCFVLINALSCVVLNLLAQYVARII